MSGARESEPFPGVTEGPRIFYRIVRTDPPTVWDFTSNEAKGRQPRRPLNARGRWLWRGLSHFDTFNAARAAAEQTPQLGSYVARLAIPRNAPVQVEQTGRAGHYTLWGQPATLLRYVVAVSRT